MKLGMKLLEMGRDMKIKHSVSSPICKVWENFFRKKALHRETNGFGQTYRGKYFTWGAITRSCKREVNG